MADVIDFLVRMGQDAGLKHASDAALEKALHDAQISALACAALMGGNRAEIEAVLGIEGNVSCLVYAPEGEEQEPGGAEQQKAA